MESGFMMGPPEVAYQQQMGEDSPLGEDMNKKNEVAATGSFTFADSDSNTNSRSVLSHN